MRPWIENGGFKARDTFQYKAVVSISKPYKDRRWSWDHIILMEKGYIRLCPDHGNPYALQKGLYIEIRLSCIKTMSQLTVSKFLLLFHGYVIQVLTHCCQDVAVKRSNPQQQCGIWTTGKRCYNIYITMALSCFTLRLYIWHVRLIISLLPPMQKIVILGFNTLKHGQHGFDLWATISMA